MKLTITKPTINKHGLTVNCLTHKLLEAFFATKEFYCWVADYSSGTQFNEFWKFYDFKISENFGIGTSFKTDTEAKENLIHKVSEICTEQGWEFKVHNNLFSTEKRASIRLWIYPSTN